MVNQKKALMSLWMDRMDVVEYREVAKPNGATGHEEATVLESEPCKLSFSTLKEVDQDDVGAAIVQTATLFCDNEAVVLPGSKIIITRQGKKFEYCRSGEPGVFTSHQEIALVPFRGWA